MCVVGLASGIDMSNSLADKCSSLQRHGLVVLAHSELAFDEEVGDVGGGLVPGGRSLPRAIQ
jgi:hypothetical protein